MKKILIALTISLGLFFALGSAVSVAETVSIPGTSNIDDVSLNVGSSGNAIQDINTVGFRILQIIKRFVMGLLVIFMVYIGAQMIMSMGSNEEQLSAAKRQIWYALVAMVFINIPGTLYEAFYKDASTSVGGNINNSSFEQGASDVTGSLFYDFSIFAYALNNQIIMFLEVMVFIAAVFMITLAGIQLLTSRGREEKMKEAKNKILYTVLALIFVGIIQVWKKIAFEGDIPDGRNLFESLADLAFFFAAPVAIFFLALAGYYLITSNGDEERAKKAKSIVVNTLLATVILLAAYTFLLDLAAL